MSSLVLPAGEPEAGLWTAWRIEQVAAFLMEGADGVRGRPWIVAVDGRGGAGKSSLAQRLLPHMAPAAVVHTDDLAWNEPLFEWQHLLADHVLKPLREGRAVSFQPPAWPRHGREGAVEIPAGLRVLLIEGTGAAQRAVADLVDRAVWVQADHDVAEERGIARDVAQGVNGDAEQARRFWHEWMDHELPFFERDRPWERADLVVAGSSVIPLEPGEIACGGHPGGPTVRRGHRT